MRDGISLVITQHFVENKMKKIARLVWGSCIVAVGTVIGLPILMIKISHGTSSVETIASLILSLLTLEATIFIAVLIYFRQQVDLDNAAARQKESAKKIIYTELTAWLESVIHEPQAGGIGEVSGQFSDLLIAYLPYCQEDFPPKQLHHLLQLADVMTSASARAVSEDDYASIEYIHNCLGLFVERKFIPAMISRYANQFRRIDDYHNILTPLTVSVLNILSGENFVSAAEDCLKAADRTMIVKVMQNSYTRIYDEFGELLCDAIFDSDTITGYGVKTDSAKTERYVGEFKDGHRHGQGCSYSRRGHRKLFEGQWVNDKEQKGNFFDVLYEKDPLNGEYEYLFPYWDVHPGLSDSILRYIYEREDLTTEQFFERHFVAEQVWVDDDKEFVNTDNLCPVEDYMKLNDPESLSSIQEGMGFDYANEDIWEDEE